jgi:DNA-binding GntR family transcriptional regulator
MTYEDKSNEAIHREQGDDPVSTLSGRVSREIRRMIIAGELRPRERLLQQQLARHFDVSQTVLREALLEAQFSGLVVAGRGEGASVAAIDRAQVMEAYEVREMLEGLSARLCCAHASPAFIRELSDLATRVHALGHEGKDKERTDLDRRLHERIRLVVLREMNHEQILSDHMAIVEAIRSGKEEEAERAARRHVVAAREMVSRQLSAHDFAFPWDAAEQVNGVSEPKTT